MPSTHATLLILLYSLLVFSEAYYLKPLKHTSVSDARLSIRLKAASDVEGVVNAQTNKALTQKEYVIAIRNRLFAVDEQIWLHEYATERGSTSKVPKLSENRHDDLLRARGDLLDEYPLTRLYLDLKDAQAQNMTYAAIYIERLISNFMRQVPLSMDHVNQIAVLSFSGQVVNLMRGQGAVYHRLLPSNVLADKMVKRQFQHPTFSASGKYIAFVELHFKDTGILRSDALVFEVPKDPKTYGTYDSMPLFDSGDLPGAPFFLRFSPDDEKLVMLCTSPANETAEAYTSLVMLDWGKVQRMDSLAGRAAVSRFSSRKALTLMQGSPLFFTYTTSNPRNATIVAHCQKDFVDPVTNAATTERAVWMLQKQDTAGVRDDIWVKICDSDPKQRWSTPVCHSAGGGDNVLVVEDGWLVTKALSRWKRGSNGAPTSKKLIKLQGQVQFVVSPDFSKVAVLQEDVNIGLYSLMIIEGEAALDPSNPSMGIQFELPNPKLTVAFWFSPDSTKLLCLTAAGKLKEDVETQKGSFRVGLNSDMQWVVYNFPLKELGEYDVFKPTPYFMKTYVPFFSQYAQVYNPWAPDSRSFIYVTNSGLCHTPLVGSKHCLGQDKWQNQGATFGTWSKL